MKDDSLLPILVAESLKALGGVGLLSLGYIFEVCAFLILHTNKKNSFHELRMVDMWDL